MSTITKERIKEIFVNNYNVGGEPSSPEMDALCKLALKGLAAEKLEKVCEKFKHVGVQNPEWKPIPGRQGAFPIAVPQFLYPIELALKKYRKEIEL